MKMIVRKDLLSLHQLEGPGTNYLMREWAGLEIEVERESSTGYFYGGRGNLNFYWLPKWLEPSISEEVYLKQLEEL